MIDYQPEKETIRKCERISGHTDGRTGGWMHGRVDGRDGWMRWMDVRIDG